MSDLTDDEKARIKREKMEAEARQARIDDLREPEREVGQ